MLKYFFFISILSMVLFSSCKCDTMWYQDNDSDGLGTMEDGIQDCDSPGENYVQNNDDLDDEDPFNYAVLINMPSIEDKKVNDEMHIHVDFESASATTIHHINIDIKNADTGLSIYSKPGTAHVHEESGRFEYHDDVILSNDVGIMAHSDWILEAKVWGHEPGAGETIESVAFHVHPE